MRLVKAAAVNQVLIHNRAIIVHVCVTALNKKISIAPTNSITRMSAYNLGLIPDIIRAKMFKE